MNIKVVILSHNEPKNTDRLYAQLSAAFDVSVFDSGSDPGKVAKSITDSFDNIYWTGAWNEILRRYSDQDVVWMPGDDLTLLAEPAAYRDAIETAMPFGCWSPAILGRAHPFMLAKNYTGRCEVINVEGMAMALSGQLMREVGTLFEGSPIGFGQDYWLCYRARKMGLRNIIDGRVRVAHPGEIRYDEDLAHDQMEGAFAAEYGKDFRQTIFQYSPRFDGNLLKSLELPALEETSMPFTIVTVDNGWGIPEFQRIVRNFPDARKVVMRKGVSTLKDLPGGIEVVDYDESLAGLIDQADCALFTRVGSANKVDYRRLLESGVPMVVNNAFSEKLIDHEKNGLVYGVEEWACKWIDQLIHDQTLGDRLRAAWDNPVRPVIREPAPVVETVGTPMVTVITPTYRRDPKILARCIDCMKLQTFTEWEQLVCSDGGIEIAASQVVERTADSRVTYHYNVEPKKEGDYGNTVRALMLAKARGDFILFLDDDNLILPQYLETMVSKLQSVPDKGFAVCRVMHFGPLNQAVGVAPKVLPGVPVKLYHIDPLQVLVRREAMQAVGWNTERGYLADGHTLQALGEKFGHVEVPEVLGIHM